MNHHGKVSCQQLVVGPKQEAKETGLLKQAARFVLQHLFSDYFQDFHHTYTCVFVYINIYIYTHTHTYIHRTAVHVYALSESTGPSRPAAEDVPGGLHRAPPERGARS